jgi:hypothetical protein
MILKLELLSTYSFIEGAATLAQVLSTDKIVKGYESFDTLKYLLPT